MTSHFKAMITKLVLRNFKSIREQIYDFSRFDLLVGFNNSGKSTVLQSLAIWQFCVEAFHRAKRKGKRGIQVVLPNFTALPVPEFNLLWTERTDRRYPKAEGNKKPEYILIEIDVVWRLPDHQEQSFGVHLRYSSPQSVYAIPAEGWDRFWELAGREKDKSYLLPIIVYVPPFSGLEDIEEWRDDGPMRQQVGKAQPGKVLRNLLLRVWEGNPADWDKIQETIKRWFSIELQPPKYKHGIDTRIICEYRQRSKSYDIIAGGSGFHQSLTLLAFLYGYRPTTILLDEPDAHLHVNLQREVLAYFKTSDIEKYMQFLIATHAEEFIRGVQVSQIYSFLYQNKQPVRVQSTPEIVTAMADVANLEVTHLIESPLILYIEGEDDERLLRAWAQVLNEEETLNRFCFHAMHGGTKKNMRDYADHHFAGVRQIVSKAKRMILFDYDSDETAFHPSSENPTLYEWQRRNIENYLLVPDAWNRAAFNMMILGPLFAQPAGQVIREFFEGENLTLPRGQTWRTVSANIFQVVDGKKILFVHENSLFQRLQRHEPSVKLSRESVARNMTSDEIHEDVHCFFAKLKTLPE